MALTEFSVNIPQSGKRLTAADCGNEFSDTLLMLHSDKNWSFALPKILLEMDLEQINAGEKKKVD